jgi:hypothetical protein
MAKKVFIFFSQGLKWSPLYEATHLDFGPSRKDRRAGLSQSFSALIPSSGYVPSSRHLWPRFLKKRNVWD